VVQKLARKRREGQGYLRREVVQSKSRMHPFFPIWRLTHLRSGSYSWPTRPLLRARVPQPASRWLLSRTSTQATALTASTPKTASAAPLPEARRLARLPWRSRCPDRRREGKPGQKQCGWARSSPGKLDVRTCMEMGKLASLVCPRMYRLNV
jgi:hypothetical protein